jgi:hypothetical protein
MSHFPTASLRASAYLLRARARVRSYLHRASSTRMHTIRLPTLSSLALQVFVPHGLQQQWLAAVACSSGLQQWLAAVACSSRLARSSGPRWPVALCSVALS